MPVRFRNGRGKCRVNGEPIDEAGLLLREGGGFVLKLDDGRRWRLDLRRMPVDLVGKRARVIGVIADAERIEADGVQPG